MSKHSSRRIENGDVVIMDNLALHNSAAAEKAIRAGGAWILFPPPYSPDLNPIEMAFSKLKARPRASAVRTIDALWRETGHIRDLSNLPNARTTSKPPDMDPLERPTL
jgi:transposase